MVAILRSPSATALVANSVVWAVFGLMPLPASAEDVVPTFTSYVFSEQPGTHTEECGVTMLVSSFPSPEYASARLQAIQGTSGVLSGKSTWGVTISAGDATISNGKITKLTSVSLSHATFSGLNFSSDGRLTVAPQPDGSIFLYGSSDSVVSAMITAFQMGDSTISFTRTGYSNIRSYTVAKTPPDTVMKQFLLCTEKIFPGP